MHGVQISLDSPSLEVHDRLRGKKGAFNAVREGVRNALRAGLYVGVSTYVTRETALDRSLGQLVGLCSEWGVHEVSVFDAINTRRLQDQNAELLDAPSQKVLLRESKALNRKHKGKLRIVTQSWTNCVRGFAGLIGCLSVHMQFHITSQGDFMSCDFTTLSVGNVREQSLQDIWRQLLQHPEYFKRSTTCRMQDPEFRKRNTCTIPEGSELTYSIRHLNQQESDR